MSKTLAQMDPIAANAERARRLAARFPPNTNPSDYEKLTGSNGAKQATGPGLARLNQLQNLRQRLAEGLRSLEGFTFRHRDSANAYRAYKVSHGRVEDTMRAISALTGESFYHAELLPDPFASKLRKIDASNEGSLWVDGND